MDMCELLEHRMTLNPQDVSLPTAVEDLVLSADALFHQIPGEIVCTEMNCSLTHHCPEHLLESSAVYSDLLMPNEEQVAHVLDPHQIQHGHPTHLYTFVNFRFCIKINNNQHISSPSSVWLRLT